MFNNFTEASIRTMMIASEESLQLDQHKMSTQALLLGLLQSGGCAAPVLRKSGLDLKVVRAAITRVKSKEIDDLSSEDALSQKTERAVQHAYAIAKRLNDKFVSTKHLLIGLISMCLEESAGDLSGASQVFRICAIDLGTLRQKAMDANEKLTVTDLPR